MQHVAIDLGGRESQICVRAPDGTIIEEKRYPTRLLDKLMNRWPQSRVIVETSAEAFRVADAARQRATKCESCQRPWSKRWAWELAASRPTSGTPGR